MGTSEQTSKTETEQGGGGSSAHSASFFFRRGNIILLGDSITQLSHSAALSGWGAHLSDVYQRRCDVLNRGMSGYNTDWYLRYLESDQGKQDVLEKNDVKLVTVFFGANDASSLELNPRHHVPIERFEINLKNIVKICKKAYGEEVKIIFIAPPPVHHDSRLKFQVERWGEKATGELERTLELSGQYASIVEKVAAELNFPCLHVWKLMQDSLPSNNQEWSKYLSDGLHLSREGNIFVGEHLIKLIEEKYPEIHVKPCQYTGYTGNSSSKGGDALGHKLGNGIGPWHDEIDHNNAEQAFGICQSDVPPSKKRKH